MAGSGGGFTVRRRTVDGDIVERHAGAGSGNRPAAAHTPVDLGKLRSVGFGSRTRDQVREGRRADGVRFKATTDELNTTVTEHAKGDRQDVHLRPAKVTGQISVKECAPWVQQQIERTRTSARS